MKVVGLAGWSGAGKTTLLTRVIPVLRERGLTVSTLKHAHHAFDIDRPGKDSHEHRLAGASEVLVASAKRWALMHELRDEAEPRLADLLVRLSPVDLVIVEGFKREAHPKVEIHRAANGKPWLFPDIPTCARCSATSCRRLARPQADLDAIAPPPTCSSPPPIRATPCWTSSGARSRSSSPASRARPADAMAQLSSDQFAFGGQLLSIEEALERVAANLPPVAGTESVALLDADGRVLAEDIAAPVSLPPFFNSAVDGYAVRFSDLAASGETRLPVAGRVPAGSAATATAGGVAVRIFTGAPMPEGCDTVFMQEDVRLEGEAVILPQGLAAGANCRPAGEDLPQGARALAAGRVMTPETIALAAALASPASPCAAACASPSSPPATRSSRPARRSAPPSSTTNRFTMQALLRRLGAAVTDLGILPDDRAAIAAALSAAAASHDLILTSGGVSTGEEDHVKSAVEAVGSLTFWRLAIKPGRPVAMGVIPAPGGGEQAAFIGLPGNPVAVFVTFAHVVRPFLTVLAGARPERPMALPVRAAFPYKKKAGRREYVRVALRRGADGVMEAVKHPRDGAGVITSLTETDGLVELPEPVERVAPGETVAFLSYALLR